MARFINTNARPTSTHIGWRVKENVSETFTSQLEKNENVIHRPRAVHIRRNCTLGLSTGYSRPRAQFLPVRTSHSKLLSHHPMQTLLYYKWSSRIFSLSTQQPLTAAKEITYINRSILRRFFSQNRRWPPVIFTKQRAGFLNFHGELVTFNDHLNRWN